LNEQPPLRIPYPIACRGVFLLHILNDPGLNFGA